MTLMCKLLKKQEPTPPKPQDLVFEAEVAADIKYIDNVDGVSRTVRDISTGNDITDFDVILKDKTIIEAKTGKFNNFKDDISPGEMSLRIKAMKELYNDIDPDLVLTAPKDQVGQVASHEFVTQLKGKVIPYATTNAEFQDVRRAWGL